MVWKACHPFVIKPIRRLNSTGSIIVGAMPCGRGEFKEHSAIGKVPILLVDKKPVPDSTAILHKLETLSNKSLLPKDRKLRAQAWIWEEYADQTFGPFVMAARWFDDRNWEVCSAAIFDTLPRFPRLFLPKLIRRRVLKINSRFDCVSQGMERCWEEFERQLDYLQDAAPAEGYWLGESPSVAGYRDCSLCCTVCAVK